ncbi:HNH endonuclease signature motif containing protein [Nocardioides panacisoli]|uniref:HNH nuclease domain-containing protein n=1 Tax=Nocardioides panacisoli TaxID=627624 RepID=A0ABP7IN02_9ACTN
MDLGKHPSPMGRYDGRSTRELLDGLTTTLRGQRDLRIDEWCQIVAWADANTTDCTEGAATLVDGYLDTGVPIAGPGAPLVSEFALMELIAVLGRSPDGGRDYVGRVIELGWRLQRTFAAVLDGRCATWRAERLADLTRQLSADAAGFVDRHIATVVGTCTWAQIERLVGEAITRFDPDLAEQCRRDAAEQRHFDIDLHHIDPNGLVTVEGVLDAADGIDLNAAVSRRATLLGRLGSADSLDVRRSRAAGELARQDLTLDLEVTDPQTGEVVCTVPGRRVELHAHLSDTAIRALAGTGIDALPPDAAVGRLGNTQTPISPFQIRDWVNTPGTTVVVRPVIDLTEHVPVGSYEIPDRLKARIRLRDPHCAFPNCHRSAEACDLDHAKPHAEGGTTCPCNLVPLCRRHHRAKTFSQWRYVIVEPGTYLWIAPNDRHFLLDPPRRLDPETMDVDHPWETAELHDYDGEPCPGAHPPDH